MAGAQTSQHSLPPAISTIFFSLHWPKICYKKHLKLHLECSHEYFHDQSCNGSTNRYHEGQLQGHEHRQWLFRLPPQLPCPWESEQNKNNKMSFKESYRLEMASAHTFFPVIGDIQHHGRKHNGNFICIVI